MEKDRRVFLQKAFGLRMRELRHRLGISQDELAFRSGLHRTYISSIERAQRNVSLLNIFQIAGALGVAPADLLKPIPDDGR